MSHLRSTSSIYSLYKQRMINGRVELRNFTNGTVLTIMSSPASVANVLLVIARCLLFLLILILDLLVVVLPLVQ